MAMDYGAHPDTTTICAHFAFVAQVSKPAVSWVSEPASRATFVRAADLEIGRHGRFGNLRYGGSIRMRPDYAPL